jgi:hypothetical protein
MLPIFLKMKSLCIKNIKNTTNVPINEILSSLSIVMSIAKVELFL